MAEIFNGRWRLDVIMKNAAFDQRFRVSGAASGNGVYPGITGMHAEVEGDGWTVILEWNNGAGSGWQESAVLRTEGSISSLVLCHFLYADDNYANNRDNDYDDLVIMCTDLDPVFDIVQRPFAMDRGTLTILPDGIFDASQGIQYMGVRIRNTWNYDWDNWTGMMIGISNASRAELTSQGIQVLDSWTSQEQQGLQQELTNGFVKVPLLQKNEEKMVYFKLDLSNAGPCKPLIRFVAQRQAWDPAYDALSRQVRRQIFVSRSTYDPATRELQAEVPEGTVYMRLNKIIVDPDSLEKAIRYSLKHPCKQKPPRLNWRRKKDSRQRSRDDLRERLKDFLEDVLSDRRVNPCELRGILEECCDTGRPRPGRGDGSRDGAGLPGEGGLGDGPGGDDWCRFKPFNWLPVEFEYRIVPNPAYTGQFGPLAFEDPWWKALLILLAIILAIASLVYDYVFAGQDPNFVIGNIVEKSNRSNSNVDAAYASLNGSRGVDLNVLDAQSDDRNNNLPIDGSMGGVASIDRSNNNDRGIEDAVLGNIVFKSGARSATTRGRVADISYDKDVDGIFYTNQVLIAPLNAPNDQPLSQGGDSGSLWVDLASRRPVALNFAGPTSDDGSWGLANPIRDVVKLFDLHFNV